MRLNLNLLCSFVFLGFLGGFAQQANKESTSAEQSLAKQTLIGKKLGDTIVVNEEKKKRERE